MMDISMEPVVPHHENETINPSVLLVDNQPIGKPYIPSQTGYIYDERMLLHKPMTPHPEQPGRISRIHQILIDNELVPRMIPLIPRKVEKQEILLVHGLDHWEKVQSLQYMDEAAILSSAAYYDRLSLYVSKHTTECAELSCGCAIEATLAVAQGKVKNSLAIIRPPGHHAEPEEHMGFCFFNNVAVATRVIQRRTNVKRILIVDWDVHHGNGTQRAFYASEDVLYISLHRYEDGEFYPGTHEGGMDHCGMGRGLGKTVNIPWPTKGVGDADYLYAFMKIVLPIAYEFAPELVIISAGFDAAAGDEVGECEVSPTGYAHMTRMLSNLADGKVAVILEGGYSEDAISASCLAVAKVLLGEAPPPIDSLVASDYATETIYQVSVVQSRHWKCLNPKALEPAEERSEDVISLTELLKAHRSSYMLKTFGMHTIPFAAEALQQSFGGQVICSKDLYQCETLLVFVHDFGNLFAELRSTLHCDLNLEHSYMVDASRHVVQWVKSKNWGMLDVNILAKPRAPQSKVELATLRDVMVYLWDNYIELSDAKSVILVSHGSGGRAMLDMINSRTVTKLVKAIVQVVSMHTSPQNAKGSNEAIAWYKANSLLVIPETHPAFSEKRSLDRRHGVVKRFAQVRVTQLFQEAMPSIQEFVQEKMV